MKKRQKDKLAKKAKLLAAGAYPTKRKFERKAKKTD